MPITTTPSGGPQGEFSTYTPIYAQTLSATTASVTFSNIPTTFTDLAIVLNGGNSRAGSASDSLTIRFNGDTGSNYSNTNLFGNGSTATSTRNTSATTMRIGDVAGSTSGLNSTSIINILNYSNPTTFKTALGRGNVSQSEVSARVGLWRNTSPITSVTVLAQEGVANWTVGTTFTLYGIKAAAPAPKATGGDLVYTDNTYWYHVFNNSGVLDVKTSINVDYLVVAGGGGGGYDSAGGGGAGGFRTGTSLSVTNQTYAITVGGGGAGSINYGVNTNGSNSVFSSITSAGGGQGANGGEAGQNGGSGGGASGGGSRTLIGSGNTPSTSPSQGNNGGQGIEGSSGNRPSGGGGGASQVGFNGSGSTAGAGGNGTSNSYSGSAVTYAGGGGGSVGVNGAAGGAGGLGGGGNGGKSGSTSPTAGAANSGGGGGAGSTNTGAAGGSGVVIVRYTV